MPPVGDVQLLFFPSPMKRVYKHLHLFKCLFERETLPPTDLFYPLFYYLNAHNHQGWAMLKQEPASQARSLTQVSRDPGTSLPPHTSVGRGNGQQSMIQTQALPYGIQASQVPIPASGSQIPLLKPQSTEAKGQIFPPLSPR